MMAKKTEDKKKDSGRGNYEKKYRHSSGGEREKIKYVDGRNFTTNDIGYYNKYPNDLKLASNVYWNQTMGAPMDLARLFSGMDYSTGKGANASLPGIMTVRFAYGPGFASTFDDAVNRSFTQLMNDLYAKTASSELPFTKSSVAMLFTSVASIANNIELIRKRMLATKLWATRNINYPKAILNAMGTDLDTEIANYNQNLVEFNSLVRMFNKLEVPAFLDVFKRQMGLCANIWSDEDDIFSQLYMFEPTGFYLYSDTENKAVWTTFDEYSITAGNQRNSAALLRVVKEQLARWYTSGDLNIIRSSFLRAYGQYTALQLSEIGVDDTLTVKGDPVIMDQLMNCDIIHGVKNLDITEDVVTDELIWTPVVRPNGGAAVLARTTYSADTKMVRMFKDNPSQDDLVEATRLKCGYIPSEGDDVKLLPNPEIVDSLEIYVNTSSTSETGSFYPVKHVIFSNVMAAPDSLFTPESFILASNFRYIPLLMVVQYHNELGLPTIDKVYVMGDIYNYTFMSTTQLINLNRVCLLSLYKIGLTAKV